MFIELDYQKAPNKKIKLNVDNILSFAPTKKNGKYIETDGTKIEMVNLRVFLVVNSYEEVSKKIDAALISKSEIFGEVMTRVGNKLFEKM